MICKNCGTKIDENVGICPKCGYILDEDFYQRYDKTVPLENLIEGENAVEAGIKNILDENYSVEDENELTYAIASDYIPTNHSNNNSKNNTNSIITVVIAAALVVITIIVSTALYLLK